MGNIVKIAAQWWWCVGYDYYFVIYRILRKLILLILCCLSSSYIYSQIKTYKLYVKLHNAQFDALSILDYTNESVFISGRKIGQFQWEFTVPDSVVTKSEYMILIVPNKSHVSDTFRQIRFISDIKGRKNSFLNFGIEDDVNFIEAEYKSETIYKNEDISMFLTNKDTVVKGDVISVDFNLVLKQDSSDITVRAQDPFYAWFLDDDDQKKSYNEHLLSYIELSRRYPDSRYLMSSLAFNLNKFKSKKDVDNIYRNFSVKHKTTSSSEKIERYLYHNFQNTLLKNFNTNAEEPIIQDSTKYNLINFSASWCIPCIQKIPVLMTLYQDLKEKIIFTYVSLDEEKGIKAFQNIAIKNAIPWRSLFAYKHLEEIRNLYFVRGIPYSLLVHPDGYMEIIDVGTEENRKKLHNLPVNYIGP